MTYSEYTLALAKEHGKMQYALERSKDALEVIKEVTGSLDPLLENTLINLNRILGEIEVSMKKRRDEYLTPYCSRTKTEEEVS